MEKLVNFSGGLINAGSVAGCRILIHWDESEWAVVSGVRQGSWVHYWFIIYMNYHNICIASDLSMFANDTKTYLLLRIYNDAAILEELNSLCEFSRNEMKQFNIDKCNILNVRKDNSLNKYALININQGLFS